MSNHSSHREVQRIRHELRMRNLNVKSVESVGPGFLSVTVTGSELAGFTSLSFDDHIKIILQDEQGNVIRRDYTPRHYDAQAQELTIEFAVHDGGFASDWARQTKAGDSLTIGGPRGSMVIPADYDWHLLIGDETALPAISRRIEELSQDAHIQVIAKINSADDMRHFGDKTNLSVIWVYDYAALLNEVVELTLPKDGEGYIWCAGESAIMASVKRTLVSAKGVDTKQLSVASYWKQGVSDFHERL